MEGGRKGVKGHKDVRHMRVRRRRRQEGEERGGRKRKVQPNETNIELFTFDRVSPILEYKTTFLHRLYEHMDDAMRYNEHQPLRFKNRLYQIGKPGGHVCFPTLHRHKLGWQQSGYR